jgi:hypothetical protein
MGNLRQSSQGFTPFRLKPAALARERSSKKTQIAHRAAPSSDLSILIHEKVH